MKKIFLILLLFTFSFGNAQDWQLLFESEKGTYYYKPNTDDTAWVKVVSDKTEYSDKTSSKLKVVDGRRLILWKFDCKSKKIGVIQSNTYSVEGKVLESFSQNELLVEMNYVVPETIGESLLSAFCESK